MCTNRNLPIQFLHGSRRSWPCSTPDRSGRTVHWHGCEGRDSIRFYSDYDPKHRNSVFPYPTPSVHCAVGQEDAWLQQSLCPVIACSLSYLSSNYRATSPIHAAASFSYSDVASLKNLWKNSLQKSSVTR